MYLDSLGEPPKEDATAKVTAYLQVLLDQEQPIPVAVGKVLQASPAFHASHSYPSRVTS